MYFNEINLLIFYFISFYIIYADFCVYSLNIPKIILNKEHSAVTLNTDLYILTTEILSKNTNFKYIKC